MMVSKMGFLARCSFGKVTYVNKCTPHAKKKTEDMFSAISQVLDCERSPEPHHEFRNNRETPFLVGLAPTFFRYSISVCFS